MSSVAATTATTATSNNLIMKGSAFNPTNIKYMAPKQNKQGGKSVVILNSLANRSLYLETPCMLTWGVADFVDKETGKSNEKYEMNLVFPSGDYASPETDRFLENLKGFEAKIKADARLHCKDWFNKKEVSDELINDKWYPMLKYRKDKNTGEYDYNYPPSLKVKVPMWEGHFSSEIYDPDGNRLYPNESNPDVTPVDLIPKGTSVYCVLQCGGLYFVGSNFGVTWKLKQAVVKPKAILNLSGRCLITLDNAVKSNMDRKMIPDDVLDDIMEEQITGIQSSHLINDSDDECDEDKPSVKRENVAVHNEETIFKIQKVEPTPVPVPVAAAPVEEEPKKIVKKIIRKPAAAPAK